MTIFTIGHSTHTLEKFMELLQRHHVDCVMDVRRFPVSKRLPHFNGEPLSEALKKAGIDYQHYPALGGRREARTDGKPSPNTLWREESFRNYSDYAQTPEFHMALSGVAKLAASRRVVLMCAEALWWQCHRRIIADYLLLAGHEVKHIMAAKTDTAQLTLGALPQKDNTLIYSGTPLFFA